LVFARSSNNAAITEIPRERAARGEPRREQAVRVLVGVVAIWARQ